MGTPLSDMMLTKLWRSSRGLHFSPTPAALQILVNDRRTFRASSGVPFRDTNTSSPGRLLRLVLPKRRHGQRRQRQGRLEHRRSLVVSQRPARATVSHTWRGLHQRGYVPGDQTPRLGVGDRGG
jgi:hypothetical protein